MQRKIQYNKRISGWGIYILLWGSLLFCALSCSTKKNNQITRLYHNFTTRYNVYYNASTVYQEAYDRYWSEVQESYISVIPPDPIRDRVSPTKAIGGAFDQTIEKCRKAIVEHSIRVKPERKAGWRKDPSAVAMQRKTEYNSYLHNAWMLIGQSQFYNADVHEAIATFGYISTLYEVEPRIRDEARLWQVRSLSNVGRYAETNSLMALVDTTRQATEHYPYLYHMAQGERLLGLGDTLRALPHIERAASCADNAVQRGRLYYLSGQLYQRTNQPQKALIAYGKVSGLSLPHGLEFASKLKNIELASLPRPSILGKLKGLARQKKYRTQWDQVYYAMGNMLLAKGDSLGAMQAYQFGADTSVLRQHDYALNLVALGDLQMAKHRYSKAYTAYTKAIPLLSAGYPKMAELRWLVGGLDSLQAPDELLHREDSLYRIAMMPERERLHYIDSLIGVYQAEQKASAQEGERPISDQFNTSLPNQPTVMGNLSKSFYFYNPALLRQGRQAFLRHWGKRTLEDDWQRKERGNFSAQPADGSSTEAVSLPDSLSGGETDRDIAALTDPKERAYYLSNLPLTPELRTESQQKRAEALYRIGYLLSNRLDLLRDAIFCYQRLLAEFPNSKEASEAMYQLYLLRSRLGEGQEAEQLRLRYLKAYPNTKLAKELAVPNYWQRLSEKDRQANQLYSQAWGAYERGDMYRLQLSADSLLRLYPEGELATKSLLLLAMSDAYRGDTPNFSKRVEELSERKDAGEEVQTFARGLLEGLRAGRKPVPGSTIANPLWLTTPSDSLREVAQDTIPFEPISMQDPKLQIVVVVRVGTMLSREFVFALTAFGFAEFTQSPPRLELLHQPGFVAVSLSSSAPRQLLARLRAEDGLRKYLNQPLWVLPINETNLNLLMERGALEAYLLFARKHIPEAIFPREDKRGMPEVIDFGLTTPSTVSLPPSVGEGGEADTSVLPPREESLSHQDISLSEIRASDKEDAKRAKEALQAKERARRDAEMQKRKEQREREKAREKAAKERAQERARAEREKKKQNK